MVCISCGIYATWKILDSTTTDLSIAVPMMLPGPSRVNDELGQLLTKHRKWP